MTLDHKQQTGSWLGRDQRQRCFWNQGCSFKGECAVVMLQLWRNMGFPSSSAGKESACNAGGPGSIPGSGRNPWIRAWQSTPVFLGFLVAQTVKNPPAMQETWVWFLGWEDPLEKCMAAHSSILAWKIPMDRGCWWATVHMGSQRAGHDWAAKGWSTVKKQGRFRFPNFRETHLQSIKHISKKKKKNSPDAWHLWMETLLLKRHKS